MRTSTAPPRSAPYTQCVFRCACLASRAPLEEATLKRLTFPYRLLAVTALLGVLAACGPSINIQNNVLPTLISVSVPQGDESDVLLQGRYFGDGFSGGAAESYVIVGADISGNGGVVAPASSWNATRIVVPVPEGAGSGYVFVVSRGVMSNGLPANLP